MNPPELYISWLDYSVQVRLLQGGIEPSDYDDNNYDYDDEVHNDDGHNGDIDKNDENDDAYADDD